MKLAFVTPRYGTEVIGGAETAARMLAERLCLRPGWEVEVLTSCALDHLTWENTEPAGTTVINGVTVHRFPTASPRTLDYFALDGELRVAPEVATLAESRKWIALNGPMCPELVDAVARSDADVIACYPYLFATTVDAIAVAQVPVVLHPAAHDEPAIYFSAFRRSFRDIDGLVYHTRAERDLMEHVFKIGARPQVVLGLGVNDPAGAGRRGGEILGLGDRPYLCYLGRVDEHKGCGMLADYFAEYKERNPSDLALAFVGPVSAKAPDHPDIVVTGTVSEADKWDILADARVMVTPSAYESFSLVVLEAWTLGVPVLVNGACAATMEHCQRSGGGLWFDSYRSFEVAVDRLAGDAALRTALGDAGRRYTADNFLWPSIIDRYTTFLEGVVARGRKAPLRTSPLQVQAAGIAYVREGVGEVTAEDAGKPDDEEGGRTDPRAGLSADERGLLEGFDRLRPEGTLRWAFDDATRRLIEPYEGPGRPAGWPGLPSDLWERGRSTKASERVLGDVVTTVAQELTEYTDRAAEEVRSLSADALTVLRIAVRDAVQFLSARVDLLESSRDPLGLQAGSIDLPVVDLSSWAAAAPGWVAGRTDLPAVMGELGDSALLPALAGGGTTVEGVDPRGSVVWAADAAFEVGHGPVEVVFSEVVDHLRTLDRGSRGCVVLAGCVDRTDLAGNVDLVDQALRVVAPGGTLVLLVTDQAAWDAALDPVVRDLLPGRPLHPETWRTVLDLRGQEDSTWLRPPSGDVHAVVAEVAR